MQPQYRGMSVPEGVKYIESHYPAQIIEGVARFSELHEISDANIALPYFEDVGSRQWLAFANAVIVEFDSRRCGQDRQ